MSNLPVLSMSSGLMRSMPRGLAQVVNQELAEGIARAARVEAAAYVTHVGLSHVQRLTATEEQLIQQNPLGEARYRMLVDSFALVAASEVRAMVR